RVIGVVGRSHFLHYHALIKPECQPLAEISSSPRANASGLSRVALFLSSAGDNLNSFPRLFLAALGGGVSFGQNLAGRQAAKNL
ncbi:MAG: hypothetical protein ACRD1I_09060, partial [Terriglobia bacterium]